MIGSVEEEAVLNKILRRDFSSFVRKSFGVVSPGVAFVPNWHIRAIAHELTKVMNGDTKRLLITMPPRSLKSVCASVAFPAYILGHDPTKRIVCVSYAEDLSAKHARDCRAVMSSEWYRTAFPQTRLSKSKSAELDFETTRSGGRLSTSVGGALTGRGGSLVIIDDPQKPADAMSEVKRASTLDWYRNTLSSRLDDKREDAIVVVMQRLHVDDLAGHLIEAGGWTHLNLPAIAIDNETIDIGNGRMHVRKVGDMLHAEREPLHVLGDLKRSMGEFIFNAQYQQAPVPEEGNLAKWEWFGTYSVPPTSEDPGRIVQSWDFAVNDNDHNDWSVCVTAQVHLNQIHVLDIFRARLNYPEQRKAVTRLARTHAANVLLIEAAANGSPLVADLSHLNEPGVPTPIAIKPQGSKVERFTVESHRIEAGDVLLPEKAPWLDEFRAEMLAFPYGRHDDQVDALSQLLGWSSQQSYHEPTCLVGAQLWIDGVRQPPRGAYRD